MLKVILIVLDCVILTGVLALFGIVPVLSPVWWVFTMGTVVLWLTLGDKALRKVSSRLNRG
jgi:hypothetical protein